MKCPFKTTTTYTKQARQCVDNKWVTTTVSCTAKDAHTVTHDYGECDLEKCHYFVDQCCSRCAGGKK